MSFNLAIFSNRAYNALDAVREYIHPPLDCQPLFYKNFAPIVFGVGYILRRGIIGMMKGKEMRDEKSSQSVLREYVRRVMNSTGLSAREIARQSNRTNAIKMSDGYITKIIDGPDYNPTIRTLRALASGMGRPEIEVLNAARGMHPDWADKKAEVTERVWDVFTSLPESQQALFLAMVESFADWTANLDSIIEGEPQYWNVPTEEADTSPQ